MGGRPPPAGAGTGIHGDPVAGVLVGGSGIHAGIHGELPLRMDQFPSPEIVRHEGQSRAPRSMDVHMN